MKHPTATCTPLNGLNTERLKLRRFSPNEAKILHAYRIEEDVARYQGWDTSFSMADAKSLVDEQQGLVFGTPGDWYQVAIVLKQDNTIVGDCAFHIDAEDPRLGEIGFTLSQKHQGFGYAQEATQALISYIFTHLGMHRIKAITDADNSAAQALLLRLGFRKEGHFIDRIFYKGAWGSEYEYALLKRDWKTS